jgi:hypothetical protein
MTQKTLELLPNAEKKTLLFHIPKLLVVWQYKTSQSEAFATDLAHCILKTTLWSQWLAQILLIYVILCYLQNGSWNFVWIQYSLK